MASSSSYIPHIQYDVFISFRGSDTRHGFLSHLTKELCRKQIDVYVDDRLERGDEISSALVKAIEGSAISLLIFSENYASSKWCLEELLKIIECKELNHQIVIPIFYNIDPTNVRHQKGTFGDAFAQHEQRYNMHKLQSWRSALNKAANLSGYHYASNFENESQLIDEVVKDVLEKLDDIYPTTESNGLVGFDGNLACVESLIEIESQEVKIVGLWGMGGIGKTTLARAICDKFFPKFESCCFLENVTEESKKNNGLNYLLQKLLSTLLGIENVNVNDVVKMKSVKRRLCRKKILVVLDDINTSEQLKYLVGEQPYLGAGSKVIITSRDKHVLVSGGVHSVYEIKELNFQDSLKLFSLNAFNLSLPTMEYKELSEEVVSYAQGIPLALKVLGSHLHSRDIKTWESVIGKLKKHPNVQIQNVLKVSYDGLDDIEKEIFLDIAFFFNGQNKDDILRVLDACNFYANSGIATLVDKALITISICNEIQMHDLLQEMAEQIVREESIKNPGRRSRLRAIEEVLDVLKNNKGTDAIEGITLNLSEINEDIQLSADMFNKMSNLRILKISSPRGSKYLELPFGLQSFPNELRYLHWDEYPLKSLPLASCAEKLVELCIRDSDVRKLWDGVQDLVSLRRIDFSGSRQLTELPIFSKARNLELVKLSYCESLCSVHPSILSCRTLVSLDLHGCIELKSLQSEIHFESLEDLRVSECINLKEFSLSSEKIQSLSLYDTKIEMLHSSFGLFNVLSELCLNGSTLKSLPINELCMLTPLCRLLLCDFKQEISKTELSVLFDALPNLEELKMDGCMKLFEIPDNISALSRLTYLSLDESGVETLPISIKLLSNLYNVSLKHCLRLRSLLELSPSIQYLDFSGCTSLETLPSNIKHLLELRYVDLKYCKRLECLPELPPSIARLDCMGCTSLVTLPSSIKHLLKLGYVNLRDCIRLECLPELPPSLSRLDVRGCTSLERVRNLPVNNDQRPYYCEYSFLGCMKMDEQSLCNVMEFTHIAMMRPPYKGEVCYPGSRVPKWLKYKETQKANSITFELAVTSHRLLGFVFCCVLPQLPFTNEEVAEIGCRIGGLEWLEIESTWPSFNLKELNKDHVFLWHFGLYEDDEITTSKLEFRFFLRPKMANEETEFFNFNDLIKACGVSPIYASDIDDDDGKQLLPLTKELKQYCL